MFVALTTSKAGSVFFSTASAMSLLKGAAPLPAALTDDKTDSVARGCFASATMIGGTPIMLVILYFSMALPDEISFWDLTKNDKIKSKMHRLT